MRSQKAQNRKESNALESEASAYSDYPETGHACNFLHRDPF